MTRLEALRALKEAVESGAWSGEWTEFAAALGLRTDNRHIYGINAYNGSLDAARALHELVLPGWDYGMHTRRKTGGVAVTVGPPGFSGAYKWHGNDCPARAWLIAILSALITQEADNDAP